MPTKKRFTVTRALVSSVTTVTLSPPVERHKHQHGETTPSLPLINQSPAYTGLPATATWIRIRVPQSRSVCGFRLPRVRSLLCPRSTPRPVFRSLNSACRGSLPASSATNVWKSERNMKRANIAGVHTHTKPSCGSGAHTDGGDRRPGGAEVNHHATRQIMPDGGRETRPGPDLGSVAARG